MEAVTILRELWRRRNLVVWVAVVSILAGLATAYTISVPPKSRSFEVGIATGRILVDTPDSQVVDVQPKRSSTLGIRAGVLANLMTEGDVKAAIAERAGLRPNQLKAGVEVDDVPPVAVTNAAGDRNAHLLTTSPATNPDGTPLPMIDIQAQAPNPAAASRLAEASVTGLNDYLDTKAAGEDVSDAKRLQVTGFGAPEVNAEMRGGRRMLAAAVAIVVFLLGCAAIAAAPRLTRVWRLVTTPEGEPEEAAKPEPEADASKTASQDADEVEVPALRSQRRGAPTAWRNPADKLKVLKRGRVKARSAAETRLAAGPEESGHDGNAETPSHNGNAETPSRNGDAETTSRNGHAETPSRNGDAEPVEADSAV
jgi:hypothetical protein